MSSRRTRATHCRGKRSSVSHRPASGSAPGTSQTGTSRSRPHNAMTEVLPEAGAKWSWKAMMSPGPVLQQHARIAFRPGQSPVLRPDPLLGTSVDRVTPVQIVRQPMMFTPSVSSLVRAGRRPFDHHQPRAMPSREPVQHRLDRLGPRPTTAPTDQHLRLVSAC